MRTAALLISLSVLGCASPPQALPFGVQTYGKSYYRVAHESVKGYADAKTTCVLGAIDFCATQDKVIHLMGTYSYVYPIEFRLDPRFGLTKVEVFFDCVDE